MLSFDRYRFDASNARLEDDSGPIRLNPNTFEVLRVLIERRGQLVLKDQLLDAVWPDTHVADGVVAVCIAEIRAALNDSATKPRFVETVHRRGYRFIATVVAESTAPHDLSNAPLVTWPAGEAAWQGPRLLVGRERELSTLAERLANALRGERQIVFVTGEPGAGKTALVEHFLTETAGRGNVAITGGQSLEQFGSTEAYMPVLDAIGRLVREPGVARTHLRRYAPTWYAQLPWLIDAHDSDRLGRELLGASRDRMLREMAEFVEALSAQIPLVLVLEDLHWSDPSTVDLLRLLAARRESARLLLLATYRPVELAFHNHPLRALTQALAANRRASEVALDNLGAKAVSEYLEQRFHNRFPTSVAKVLRDRTDGNPLFMVTLVDHLLARGGKVGKSLRDELADVPETLRLLIEQQFARLEPEDRSLLEAASFVGIEFSAAAAAAGADRTAAQAEERCERLAGAGSFLRNAGTVEWPDGTLAGRYAFRHALYREALLKAAPRLRRADVQLRIGRVLEAAYGERAAELAAALAVHFEEGGDRSRAVHYRRLAAETAAGRHALVEAESHLESGLALLAGIAVSTERDREELLLQSALGAVRIATRGYAAPQVVSAYTRALELSTGAPEEPSVFPVLWGLWSFYTVRGELDRALELAGRNHAIAEASANRLMRLVAHLGLWTTHFFRGEFAQTLRHLDEGEPLYDLVDDHRSALAYGQDQKVVALAQRSILLWYLGRADAALEVSRRSVEHARALAHPMSLAFALSFAGWLHILRREPQACREQADSVIAFATEEGLPHWIPGALHSRGWALAELGELEAGIAEMERGLEMMSQIGAKLGKSPRHVDLAAAQARAGRLSRARALIEEAKQLGDATGERYHEAEIHRLDAELVLAEGGGAEAAEKLLDASFECASRQGAPMLELRAATALARLHPRGAKAAAARTRLAGVLASIPEGFDTADLAEARRIVAG